MSTLPHAQLSPARRAWLRFRRHRLGFASLLIFTVLFVLSLGAELLSNDKPLVVRYQGQWYFPVAQALPETVFGGDFETPTDYLDPFIQQQLAKPGNWALHAPNRYHHTTLDYFAPLPNPAPPTAATGSAPTTAAAMCWRACSTAFAFPSCLRSRSRPSGWCWG